MLVYLSDSWTWNHCASIFRVLRAALLRCLRPIRQRRRKVCRSRLRPQLRTIRVGSEAYIYQGANSLTWCQNSRPVCSAPRAFTRRCHVFPTWLTVSWDSLDPSCCASSDRTERSGGTIAPTNLQMFDTAVGDFATSASSNLGWDSRTCDLAPSSSRTFHKVLQHEGSEKSLCLICECFIRLDLESHNVKSVVQKH
jgi:hypothetical protein